MRVRVNLIAVMTIGCALSVLLFVGASAQPLEPAVPTTKLISSASQSPDVTPVSLPDDLSPTPTDPTPTDVAAAPEATPPAPLTITVTLPMSTSADESDPSDTVHGLPPNQPAIETPVTPVDDARDGAIPLPPSAGRRGRSAGAVPVLMYHYVRVNPVVGDRAGFVLSVTPHDFAQQIRFLATHGYTAVTMAAVRDYIRTGKKLPPKPVALTFDDGYDDAYSEAMPVLAHYHMTATFYIVTGFVDRPRYVTWDQVIAMDRADLEIASHTIRHPTLPVLAPMARQWELTASRSTLESRLGHAIFDFCYPGGQLDVATEQAVARAGYLSATTTASGFAAPGDDPFRVPRLRISGGMSLASFARIFGENLTANDTITATPTAASTTTFPPLPLDLQPSSLNRIVARR